MRFRGDRISTFPRLEVDGGVKVANTKDLAVAGVDVFVAGSAIFESPDYRATIQQLREAIDAR